MRKLIGRRPSPALVLAFIALMVALSGVAIGLPGKSTVQGNDLKKNAVTGKAVKDDSLGGSDVDESTLGQVPSATSATSATTATTATTASTSDETARLLHWNTGQIAEGASKDVLSVGGLTLTANCADQGGGSTILRYTVSGPADAFAEGEANDLDPGELPGIVNQDTSSTTQDLMNSEDNAAFMLGNGSGLRAIGLLGGLIDATAGSSGICEAWGFATID